MNTSTSSNKLIAGGANFTTWGIQVGDKVKNITTGEVANVTNVDSDITLTLDSNIFPTSGVAYAVTATINVKVIDISINWDLPGLNFCDYTLAVMQVK